MKNVVLMKVAVIGPNFFSYNEMIARAFDSMGMECTRIEYPTIPPYLLRTYQMKFMEAFTPARIAQDYRNFLNRNELTSYFKGVLSRFEDIKPDLILLLKGEIFNRDFIKNLRKKVDSALVIWAYDSAKRYNSIKRIGDEFDLIYTFEPSDIPALSGRKISAKFLPLAYDDTTYFPMDGIEIQRDLCFVGKLKGYSKRKKELEKVMKKFGKDHNMKVWGRQYNNRFERQYYRSFYPALFPHLENENLSPENANDIYNTSAISLNIHHGQSVNGLNPRTFEITGSKGFQIVDHKSALNDLFDMEREIVSYKTEKELIEKVGYYLGEDDERKKISERGYKRAQKDHRFENRMMTVLTDLEEKGSL